MGGTTETNIFTIVEQASDMTLFDCRWVPCSTRFVVAGTHTKGHGILRVYTMSNSNGVSQLGKLLKINHWAAFIEPPIWVVPLEIRARLTIKLQFIYS